MRISDWSSDVCSSDLPGGSFRVVREHLEHRRVLVAHQELDRAVLQRLESRRRAEDVAELHVLRGRQCLQHRPLRGELVEHPLAARNDLAELPHAIAAQVGTRSEEHTSALQTLMRTSYAVSCLKQKK